METLTWQVTTHEHAETKRLGHTLGENVLAGDVICLQGELGAGKTTFVQGFGAGLGIRQSIHSPTFILANEHRGGRMPLYHLDAYRVGSTAEAIGFGLDDYIDGRGVVVIEWAEKVHEALPAEHLWIEFEHAGENARTIRFTARGARYATLLSHLRATAEALS